MTRPSLRGLVAAVALLALAVAFAACQETEEEPSDGATKSPAATTTASAEPTPVDTTPPTAAPSPSSPESATPGTGELRRYTDSAYGFSFEYPGEWFESPDSGNGYVAISTYDPLTARGVGPVPGNQTKIEFHVDRNPSGLTLAEWIAQNDSQTPGGVEIVSQADDTVGGVVGIRRVVRVLDSFVAEVIVSKGGAIYFVVAYHADSPQIETLETILASFRFG